MRHHLRLLLLRLDRRLVPFDALLNLLGVGAGLEGVVHHIVLRYVSHVESRHLSLFRSGSIVAIDHVLIGISEVFCILGSCLNLFHLLHQRHLFLHMRVGLICNLVAPRLLFVFPTRLLLINLVLVIERQLI